ncbi:hypothetical protein ABTF02_12470 [Acinetobacter baumannii]
MNPYFFGINPWFLYAFLAVLAVVGILLIRINKLNNTTGSGVGVIFIGLAIISGFSFHSYMSKPISSADAKKLDLVYDETYGNPRAEAFRNEMSELAKKNGVVVSSAFSYAGSDIYIDYITRSDFNRLAKLYEESKKLEFS